MASISCRNGRWQVQVRRLGTVPLARSFDRRSDAERWARQVEGEIDRHGVPVDPRALRHVTVGDLLRRYEAEITPRKKSAPIERWRIAVILRHEIASVSLEHASPALFAKYRDDRLKVVCGKTARKDLILLRHMFEIARREWGLLLPRNPLDDVPKPPPSKPRDWRLSPTEVTALVAAFTRTRNPILGAAMLFAIETGMRRGELLRMHWRDINAEASTACIPEAKNGYSRTIPLSPQARQILEKVAGADPDRVFPMTADALRHAWERLRHRAGLPGSTSTTSAMRPSRDSSSAAFRCRR